MSKDHALKQAEVAQFFRDITKSRKELAEVSQKYLNATADEHKMRARFIGSIADTERDDLEKKNALVRKAKDRVFDKIWSSGKRGEWNEAIEASTAGDRTSPIKEDEEMVDQQLGAVGIVSCSF